MRKGVVRQFWKILQESYEWTPFHFFYCEDIWASPVVSFPCHIYNVHTVVSSLAITFRVFFRLFIIKKKSYVDVYIFYVLA